MNIFNKIIDFYQMKKINSVLKAVSYIDQQVEPGRRLRMNFNKKSSFTFEMIDGWQLEFNQKFIHQIKNVDPFDINTYDYVYYYRIFLTLYIFIKDSHWATIKFDQVLFGINIEFDRDSLDIFMKKPNSADYIMLLANVKDANDCYFLDFFIECSLDRWLVQKNTDYLLIYLKYYLTLHNHGDPKDWFKNQNSCSIREYMPDILCLVNDHYPNFLDLVKPMDHERLKTAYHISCMLEIPLLEAINNHNLIPLDLNMEII